MIFNVLLLLRLLQLKSNKNFLCTFIKQQHYHFFLLAKISRLFKQNTWANKSTFLRQLRLHQKIRRYFYVFKVVMMVLQFDDFFTKWKLIFFTLKRHNYAINIVCNIYLRHFLLKYKFWSHTKNTTFKHFLWYIVTALWFNRIH